MFDRDRTCPVCNGRNHIHVRIVGGSKALPMPIARCGKCDYITYFLGIGLLSYFGNALAAFLGLVIYLLRHDTAISPLIIMAFFAAWILIFPFIWLGLFVKTDIFSGYIDRKITAQVRREEEIERVQQLINSDKAVRKSILRRFMIVLSAVTIACAIITVVLILRIAMIAPGNVLDLCLLFVLSTVYLVIYWEWKAKLDTLRKGQTFSFFGLYFLLGAAAAIEAMVAAYTAIQFML